jgi:thioester reductase-like protein
VSLFIYADSHRSCIVAIGIPGPEHTDIQEETVLRDLQRIASECNFRSFEIPARIHLEREMSSWIEGEGLLTSAGKLCRRNLLSHYRPQIEGMYVNIALGAVLEVTDSSKSFQELGGTSVDAVRLIQQLRQQMVEVSFEDLMGSKPLSSLSGAAVQASTSDDKISIKEELTTVRQLFEQFSDIQGNAAIEPKVYFVTGATGFLGSQLLDKLLEENPEARFFCLCRSPASFEKSAHPQVEPIVGDLSSALFGLSESQFQELADNVDAILHCGFVVNHLVSYKDMYHTNVSSILDIIRLSVSGAKSRKPIHFTSSISALTRSPRQGRGYGATKWAVDHLLMFCKETYALPVYIYRPCLISGNRQTGQINRRDWFHRLLQAIADARIVPPVSRDEPMNIVSSDYCVEVIVHLMKTRPSDQYQFNITQTNTGWKGIIALIKQARPDIRECSSHEEWFLQLSQFVKDHAHPVTPFLSSFEFGMVDSFHAYDNASTLQFAPHCPLIPIGLSDIELTMTALESKS